MTKRLLIGRGKATVELTGALAGALEDELLGALGPIGDHMRERGMRLLGHAKAEWPVRTGQSRDSLNLVTRVDPSRMKVEAVVQSGVRYARYIQWGEKRYPRRGVGAKGPPGTVPIARETDSHGNPVTIWGPRNPWRRGRTRGRGGVLKDLLRTPAIAERKQLRRDLPRLIVERWKKAGVASG